MHRNKRQSCISFSPFALLVHGLLILPVFLLQEKFLFRIIQTALFLILSLFVKKKKHLLFSLFTFISIAGFHLFTPHGQVLYNIFSLPITAGALKTGIFKAATFIGLLSLSKIMIMKDLTITGSAGIIPEQGNNKGANSHKLIIKKSIGRRAIDSAGAAIGKVFYYFEALKTVQEKHQQKDIIKRIDMILMEVTALSDVNEPVAGGKKKRVSKTGGALITLSVLFHWGLFIVSLFIA